MPLLSGILAVAQLFYAIFSCITDEGMDHCGLILGKSPLQFLPDLLGPARLAAPGSLRMSWSEGRGLKSMLKFPDSNFMYC